jgi:hypothetical protein
VALAACAGGDAGNAPTQATAPAPPVIASAMPPPPARNAFASATWHFRIDVPPGWTVRRDFRSGYLSNGAWKTFAAPDSRGEPVVSLTMPGSDRITDAEIRIGASRAADEVQRCTRPPSAVRSGSIATQRINGVTFTTFQAADAAMSHRLDVHAYRTVRNGACYAIDLLVFGVNPDVYDPPATPPFSDAEAFDAMRTVLQGLRFVPEGHQATPSTSTTLR